MNQFRNKYNQSDYKNKCDSLGLEYLGYYSSGTKKGTMIKFICPKHRDKGMQETDWSHFKNLKFGCKYCAGRGFNTQDIQSRIKNKDVILISPYIGYEKPIKCKCASCGNIWQTKAAVLIGNGGGCPVCGKIKASLHEMKSEEKFKEDLAIANPNIEAIGKYNGTHRKIKCRCKIDGTEWDAYPANLLNNSAGCPTCSMSNGQRKMLIILNNLGYNIVSQYKFDDCKCIERLRFDGYDVENNIAYEFNGEQHYKVVDWGSQGVEKATKVYNDVVKRDTIKYNYCKDNGIPLIIIPYWHFYDMQDFIVAQIKKFLK